jgi:threonylcarbamoyladenosine tRNA methylthiotransferase MtaB
MELGRIVEQVQLLVGKGYSEVVLTGINITSYGKDFPEKLSLGKALKKLLQSVPALKRLRLSSLDVAEIDEDLFELITTEERFMPHLHLSLQSGDNIILRKMRRRHTREQVQAFCQAVRKARPDLGFGADIITGFPTETEDQFVNTCELIEELAIPYMHVFPYSERYDTIAARMPQVDKRLRKDRAKILRMIGQKNLDNFSQSYVGKQVEVLLENSDVGRMRNFLKVMLEPNDLKAGELVRVKIIDYKDSNLIGEIAL